MAYNYCLLYLVQPCGTRSATGSNWWFLQPATGSVPTTRSAASKYRNRPPCGRKSRNAVRKGWNNAPMNPWCNTAHTDLEHVETNSYTLDIDIWRRMKQEHVDIV
jgi:hypothetical protein